MEGSENRSKKFYWIKLRTDFFQEDSPIDFLMSQENGSQYVVLYQMLCLKTANSHGELSTQIGEMIVPYDVKKIARDTKYFDVDTVTVALELFKHLGLIYEQDDGNLRIANYQHMIGSESASKEAAKKRLQREKQQEKNNEITSGDINGDKLSLEDWDKEVDEMSDRDKEIRDKEIRDKEININISSTNVDDCPSLQEERSPKYVYQDIVDLWNTLEPYGIAKKMRIPVDSPIVPQIRKRLRDYGDDIFVQLIEEIKNSDFLLGRTGKKPFHLTFNWAVGPENFQKIIDGNYRNNDSNISFIKQNERFKGYE